MKYYMCKLHVYTGKLWENIAREMPSLFEGEYFPFVESEGIDRRHAILEISTYKAEDEQKYFGSVFDTISKTILWSGGGFSDEDSALQKADDILTALETIQGFGSISLQKRIS